jgi:DNA-binding transcriptional regulator YiaG
MLDRDALPIETALERARLRRRLPDYRDRRIIRERARVTQVALARAVGVARPTVSRWETGSREPADEHLGAYIRMLDMFVYEIGSARQ